jgi:arylsulfatase A-like enzyme
VRSRWLALPFARSARSRTNSLCAPSRASFLTGPHSHGVTTNGEEPAWLHQRGLARDQETWPKLLRNAGYASAVVGKWHIKSLPFGFDHFAILPGQGEYFDPEFIVNEEHLSSAKTGVPLI